MFPYRLWSRGDHHLLRCWVSSLLGGPERFPLCGYAGRRYIGGDTAHRGTPGPATLGTSSLGRNYWCVALGGYLPIASPRCQRTTAESLSLANDQSHAASISWLGLTVGILRCAPAQPVSVNALSATVQQPLAWLATHRVSGGQVARSSLGDDRSRQSDAVFLGLDKPS
jgi:hypothetical protein